VESDEPRGCWSLQLCERKETSVLRSLTWPGFQFFHCLNTNKFGNCYIGDGLKNQEVHFIIQ
jgi:hypothetical protein